MDDCGRMRADTSANIYESMLTSDAFALLTTKQQILYVFCKAQYYGKRKPEKDFPEVEQMQGGRAVLSQLGSSAAVQAVQAVHGQEFLSGYESPV